ncbi:unnamed protein product [Caenorhabditis bovis]|uniref:ferroxidase n=1 Tax=Caenorhabditis bovis TaxID=2654633 RepID=A0A8S1EUW7_9PELO|nr:unnamed protein product [Caenorhabditis bovis]
MLRGLRAAGVNFSRFQRFSVEVSQNEYETVAEETLQRLSDYFDHFGDVYPVSEQYDVSHSMGVLTVVVSEKIGTYVINKQSPNKQIWLSSPISGPKRYDLKEKRWVYAHDGEAMDELLNREFRRILNDENIDFHKILA